MPRPDYEKTGNGVRRRCDGAFIPADPLNRDWQAYQAWLAAGNVPAEPVAAPEPTGSTEV